MLYIVCVNWIFDLVTFLCLITSMWSSIHFANVPWFFYAGILFNLLPSFQSHSLYLSQLIDCIHTAIMDHCWEKTQVGNGPSLFLQFCFFLSLILLFLVKRHNNSC